MNEADNLVGQIVALKAAANAYGQGDNRRIVAIEEDLVNAILAARTINGRALPDQATDRVLSRLISYYIYEIESQWA